MNTFTNILLIPFAVLFGGFMGSIAEPILGTVGFWVVSVIASILFFGFNYDSDKRNEEYSKEKMHHSRGPSPYSLIRFIKRH